MLASATSTFVAANETPTDGSSEHSLVDVVVDSFYGGLEEQYGTDPASLYHDEKRLRSYAMATRSHLESHVGWISGPDALSAEGLRTRIALQHFTCMAIDDVHSALQNRPHDDGFDEKGISKHFLLEAAGGNFIIGTERFSFLDELKAIGVSSQDSVAGHLLSGFKARLVAALLHHLGSEAPAVLVRVVSSSMSHIGIANLERACGRLPCVVQGGEGTLCHQFTRSAPGVWELQSSRRKDGFEQIAINDERSGELVVLACSPESQVSRSCKVRFESPSVGQAYPPLKVDVLDVAQHLKLLDTRGRTLSLRGLPQFSAVPRRNGIFRTSYRSSWLRRWLERCGCCTRRARQVAAGCAPQTVFVATPSCSGHVQAELEGAQERATTPGCELPV